jgi:hypothetical protein
MEVKQPNNRCDAGSVTITAEILKKTTTKLSALRRAEPDNQAKRTFQKLTTWYILYFFDAR